MSVGIMVRKHETEAAGHPDFTESAIMDVFNRKLTASRHDKTPAPE